MYFAATIAAICIVLVVLQDAFEVMLLPRRVHRRIRLTRLYFAASWATWSGIGARLTNDGKRERFLSVFGALFMMILFVLWSTALIIGFGLLQWSLEGGVHGPDGRAWKLSEAIYMSGVTFFTLGYGDVVPHAAAARFAAVVEAGMGIGFIAVVIGYLPVLYQLFSRREAHVMQLDARAGSPPTATTMLCRHVEAGGLAKLDELLREWEVWSAELLESHLTYPMLIYYRSQHENQSWLAAVAAVMDVCALVLIGVRDLQPLQARMTFTMLRQVIVEMARSFRLAPSRYDGGDRLPPEEYARMVSIFTEAGLGWENEAGARETLASLRATYEPLLDALGRSLVLSVPPFIAADDAADHWQRGHRGLIASRLVEQLSTVRVEQPASGIVRGRFKKPGGKEAAPPQLPPRR